MKTVAIVGGGFTGAAVAFHLARASDARAVRIVVFEPRAKLGAGLAYGTDDPVHRINVPAAKMSLLPEDDTHFARWLAAGDRLAADPEAVRPDGCAFPARALFGDYVAAHLRPLVADGIVEHVRESVSGIARTGARWRVATASGAQLDADVVVLATSHPPPVPPAVLRGAEGAPGFVVDATAAGALDGVAPDADVLVVGAGLTAADIVGTLRARGHGGRITLVSRHGLRSRGHAPAGQAAAPLGDFVSHPATTAVTLLRRVRAEVRAATAAGLTWHPVFDALRLQGGAIWRALPIAERRRLVRHLRSFWDVHRFRIAPQLDELLVAELAAGGVEHVAGRVVAAAADPGGGFTVEIRLRAGGAAVRRRFGALVVATGPAHGTVLASQPHLAALAAAGVLTPDPVGLGIACDDDARALRADGTAEPDLFVAGPLARGTFGELMGLPQVTEHAAFVATAVARLVPPSTAAA